MSGPRWLIHCQPDDLEEGLFGQVVLWVFELLPGLAAKGVQPTWDIRSRLYGDAPDCRVLPGVFDTVPVAGDPATARRRGLLSLRSRGVSVLGNDWQGLHRLWHASFRVPARIEAAADAAGLTANTLGLHFRGTDKNLASLDTNPVSADDFLRLAQDHLQRHPQIDAIFLATDEPGLVAKVRERLTPLPVIHLGDVPFHKSTDGDSQRSARADRALLDCVLLSRCASVLKCSSALSGFAKVLNPQLQIYRVAACKLFSDVPYFPDAWIPPMHSTEPECQRILQRQMQGDWLTSGHPLAALAEPFVSRQRGTLSQRVVLRAKYLVSLALGRPRKA